MVEATKSNSVRHMNLSNIQSILMLYLIKKGSNSVLHIYAGGTSWAKKMHYLTKARYKFN
jgi:hypothetical protein